jgi:hypothetical protein
MATKRAISDRTKMNSRHIQVEIETILKQQPEGLHFNGLFKYLEKRNILHSYNILSDNLKQLMREGKIKNTQQDGKGFGKSIYTWTAHDKTGLEEQWVDTALSQWLPFVQSSRVEDGELKSVHLEKGHGKDFERAVNVFNSVADYCQPIIKNMSEPEKQFILQLFDNMEKLLQIQSSLLREENPTSADAKWQIFLQIVMKNIEMLLRDFAVQSSTLPKETLRRNALDVRKRVHEINQSMLMERPIDLNRMRIYD